MVLFALCIATSPRLKAQDNELNLSYTDDGGSTMQYRLYLPDGYDSGREFPVVVWLHGAGGSIGSRPQSLVDSLRSGPYSAFLLEPAAGSSGGWTTCDGAGGGSAHVYCAPGLDGGMKLMLEVLEEVESQYSIDTSQRVVTGYSAGGVGAFEVVLEKPGFFSAAVPIQSGHDGRRFREPVGTRIWAMHGRGDTFLLPLYSRSTVQALTSLGESPIYLEPPDGHVAGYRDAFFADADNELYPWLFEGVAPALGQLIYDPLTGGVQIDAASAPGGRISRMTIYAGDETMRPSVSAIEGDPVSFRRGVIEYTATDGEGFGGLVDLGPVLPPGLDLTSVHNSVSSYYDSPQANTANRPFRVVMATESPLDEVIEEPWLVYRSSHRNAESLDLGLSTVGQVGRSDAETPDDRIVAKFQLPDLADTTQFLEQAVLRFYLVRNSGDGSEVVLSHSVEDNDHEQLFSDFTDSSYVNTGLTLVSSIDPNRRYYELDVTELVQADYVNDETLPVSSFRLQLGEEGTGGFRLSMPRDRFRFPQLVLNFTPDLDCDGDGSVSEMDLTCAASDNFAATRAKAGAVLGDFDLDGEVNFADFLLLSSNFGNEESTYADGDADLDGSVGFSDFLILSENFGLRASAVSAVPEPNANSLLLMLVLAAKALCASRIRQGAAFGPGTKTRRVMGELLVNADDAR